MNVVEKRCIIDVLKSKHRRAKKKVKGEIITELSERLSVGRKHAIKLLSSKKSGRPKKGGKRRGRPSE